MIFTSRGEIARNGRIRHSGGACFSEQCPPGNTEQGGSPGPVALCPLQRLGYQGAFQLLGCQFEVELRDCLNLGYSRVRREKFELTKGQISLQYIAQFSDIPRPVVLHEQVHYMTGNSGGGVRWGHFLDKMVNKQRDILFPSSQRWNLNLYYLQPIKEIAAHLPFVDLFRKRDIGS